MDTYTISIKDGDDAELLYSPPHPLPKKGPLRKVTNFEDAHLNEHINNNEEQWQPI